MEGTHKTWMWDPRLEAAFAREGLEWEVLDRRLTGEELGSCPGDCFYDGSVVIFERSCPENWVAHELAHYLVCRRDTPEHLDQVNYGFDTVDGGNLETWWEKWEDPEKDASDVNVAILICLGMPWMECAVDLNALYSIGDIGATALADYHLVKGGEALSPDHKVWEKVKQHFIEKGRPYIDWPEALP